jgi:2,4-dienoyl-CoA reductase-like NADH-dependent reductase (Old Yellow Enzyme family)
MLARVFRFVEEQGAVPGMQLAQAGGKASSSAPWKAPAPQVDCSQAFQSRSVPDIKFLLQNRFAQRQTSLPLPLE